MPNFATMRTKPCHFCLFWDGVVVRTRVKSVHDAEWFEGDIVESECCDNCGTLLYGRCVVDDRVVVGVLE